MFEMSEKLKKGLEKTVGLSCEQMSHMDIEEIEQFIETKNGKKLKYQLGGNPEIAGEPLLVLGRIIRPEELEKKINKIIKEK